MNSTSRTARVSLLTLALRLTAAALLLAVFGLWIGTGAHRGWTQTSQVVLQHDDITGIDFPVREKTFVAGLEIVLTGTALSTALAAASALTNRHRAPKKE